MDYTTYLSYFTLVFTLVYTPGPMTLFLLAHGLRMNFKDLLPILFGGSCAYLLSILIFSLGLAAIIQGHRNAILATHLLGVLYLLYLAYKQITAPNALHINGVAKQLTRKNYFKMFISGFWVAASNPKSIVLFALIFPEFVDSSRPYGYQIGIMAITFLILQFSSASVYAYGGKRIRSFIEIPGRQKHIRYVCALVLILVACYLVYNGRAMY